MNNQKRLRLSNIALCVAIAVGSASVYAQNTTSAISGRITAVDGKSVAGAQVKILHIESGSVTNTTTDAEGRYSARGLRTGGPYTVTITKDGKTETRTNVFLALAETATLDAKLGEAKPKVETIEVAATAVSDVFSKSAMGAGSYVSRADLDSFASIQRNLQDYARADPRLAQTDKDRGEISMGGQNTRYNSVTIDGVTISDTFGLESNNLPTVKQPISIDAIESVQVNISNYDVTQKGYTGANINASTKSGTNEFKGSVYSITRDNKLSGQTYSRGTGLYQDQRTFDESTKGFTFGGPIIKDTLFFFATFEDFTSTRRAQPFGPIGSGASSEIGITPSAIATAQSLSQSRYGINAGAQEDVGFDVTSKDTLLKLDWNIDSKNRASLRYTKTEQKEPFFPNFFNTPSTALSLSSNWYTQDKTLETIVGQWFADWSSTLSTEVKISSRDYNSAPKPPVATPEITLAFSGLLPAGTPSSVVGGTRNLVIGTERSRHFNLLDTKTLDAYAGANWFLGAHELKFAADYTSNKIYNAFLQDTKGRYTFSCQNSSATYTYTFGAINCATATAAQVEAAVFENYTRGRPSTYSVQVPLQAGGSLSDGVSTFTLKNYGLALQDTWTVNKNLSVMFGLRLDTPALSAKPRANAAAAAALVPGNPASNVRQSGGFGLDNTNNIDGQYLVQPRFGFNYTFDSKRPMQIRGGFGLFQGAAANVWISNIYSNTGTATRLVGCGAAFAACPVGGGIFSADPASQITNFAGAAPAANVDFLEPGLGQPSVWKANLAFETQLPWFGIVASVEYLNTRTNSGIYYQHLNLGAPTRTGADGRQMFYTASAYNPACWTAAGGRLTTGAVCSVDNRNRALSNPAFANVLLAAKTKDGGGDQVTVSMSGRFMKSVNWSLAYTRTNATEVSPLTSSVSNSNWAARSIFNPNESGVANSVYLVKDRVNGTMNWSRSFIKGYKTSVGMFYEGRSGKPYSWTFQNDLNGDGLAGNDLMYIPKGPGSGEVVFLGDTATDKTNENRFWAIVDANPGLSRSRGGVAKRNDNFSPWVNSIDVRASQEFPGFVKGHKAVFVLDVLNFGNLLNKKWGRVDEISFQSNGGQPRNFVNFAGIDPQGRYIYSVSNVASDFTTRQNKGESQWAAQFTFRYEF